MQTGFPETEDGDVDYFTNVYIRFHKTRINGKGSYNLTINIPSGVTLVDIADYGIREDGTINEYNFLSYYVNIDGLNELRTILRQSNNILTDLTPFSAFRNGIKRLEINNSDIQNLNGLEKLAGLKTLSMDSKFFEDNKLSLIDLDFSNHLNNRIKTLELSYLGIRNILNLKESLPNLEKMLLQDYSEEEKTTGIILGKKRRLPGYQYF